MSLYLRENHGFSVYSFVGLGFFFNLFEDKLTLTEGIATYKLCDRQSLAFYLTYLIDFRDTFTVLRHLSKNTNKIFVKC